MPERLCECGCGQPAPISPYTNRHIGYVEGEPRRFIHGHNLRRPPSWTVDPDTGCWLWDGYLDKNGYGRYKPGGKAMGAHRWAYEHFTGPIPEGFQIDHLCRVTACVNPAHLEAVTPTENVRRSTATFISEETIRAVRAATGTTREIGARFGVSSQYVSELRRGQWRQPA